MKRSLTGILLILCVTVVVGCSSKVQRPTVVDQTRAIPASAKSAGALDIRTIGFGASIQRIEFPKQEDQVVAHLLGEQVVMNYVTGWKKNTYGNYGVKSRDGRYSASIRSNTLAIKDDPEQKIIATIPVENYSRASFSPDDKFLLVDDWGTSTLFDPSTGKKVFEFDSGMRGATFSHDGRNLFTTNQGGIVSKTSNIRSYDLSNGRIVFELETEGSVSTVALSPDGKFLALGMSSGALALSGKLIILDAYTGQILADKRLNGVADEVAFSPDNALLAIGIREDKVLSGVVGSVFLYDTTTWLNSYKLDIQRPVSDLQFSPNSRLLAMRASDVALVGRSSGSAFLLDVKAGAIVHETFQDAYVTAMAFSQDGTRFAIGNEEGQMRIIFLSPELLATKQ